MELYFYNEENNAQQGIRRHVMVSYGQAYVGNIGGLNHAREVTVMGDAANILSRIDLLTKHPNLKDSLPTTKFILTQEAAQYAQGLLPQLEFLPIKLKDHNVHIKDFEEVDLIYTLDISETHYQSILDYFNRTQGAFKETA